MAASPARSHAVHPITHDEVPEISATDFLCELFGRFKLPESLVADVGRRCAIMDRFNRYLPRLARGRVASIAPNSRGQLTVLVEPEFGEGSLDDNMPNGMLYLEGRSLDTLYLIQRTPRIGFREVAVRLVIL